MKKSKKSAVRKMKKHANEFAQELMKDIPPEEPRVIDLIQYLSEECGKIFKHDWQPSALNWIERNKHILLVRDEGVSNVAMGGFLESVRNKA